MSYMLPVTIPEAAPPTGVAASASPSEKTATSGKQRSCVVCRTRRVRCDRESPCSNCRRAGIACVSPSTDRPPRWARRLERVANNAASKTQSSRDPDPAAAQVMERLRNLENLVKELSSQLEQSNTAATSLAGGSPAVNSVESSTHNRSTDNESDASPGTNAGNFQKQFGRLVLQDANRSRYVSSGFWSRVSDELDGLKTDSRDLGVDDSDTSEDEPSPGKSLSTQELELTPSQRHAFLFRHNLNSSAPDLREFHPLPSQRLFLLDVYTENVNFIISTIHTPTVTKMIRGLRGSDVTSLTPANEALMFSIYYAAITSMEEDDVMTNFGFTKTDLNLKYRLGLEHALAKADFLNVPDLVLVQAFAIFLYLVRRHDSPRFVWMMTGLLIRMGQALGLHRDGTHFKHLTPYEIEMRRRVWWAICMVDMRASEDQGTDFTIVLGSSDTKLPLNINDADFEPEITKMPPAREGITDMTIPLIFIEIGIVSKKMMAQSTKEDGVLGIEDQSRFLNEIYQKLDQGYLQHSVEAGNILYWVAVCVVRIVMAKMTLLVYLPILFSSPSEHFSDTIKTKLLVAAIELAEYNHAINTEQVCRRWHWIYQTYTHWYAIVYLLIEICRRPWSPIVERAWVALHSEWLVPAQSHMDKSLQFWIPLRKLTAKARKHRHAELERLRGDPQAAERLVMEDQRIPMPTSPGLFPAGSNVVELYHEKWRQLLVMPERLAQLGPEITSPSTHSANKSPPSTNPIPVYNSGGLKSNDTFEQDYFNASGPQTSQNVPGNTPPDLQQAVMMEAQYDFATEQNIWPPYNAVPAAAPAWPGGPGTVPWLWADADPSVDVFGNVDVDVIDINMELDGEMDWYHWIESTQGLERVSGQSGNGRT